MHAGDQMKFDLCMLGLLQQRIDETRNKRLTPQGEMSCDLEDQRKNKTPITTLLRHAKHANSEGNQ
jgi:hypothetical protein